MNAILFSVIGLCLGSFLNVIVYRLPRRLGFISGRSNCTHCSVEIKSYDLIPVLSFIMLRGRCRSCKNIISWRYPIIEISFAIIAYLVAMAVIPSYGIINAFIAIIFALLFSAIALIDFEHFIIPDNILIVILALTIILGLAEQLNFVTSYMEVFKFAHLQWAIILSGISYFLWRFSKGMWLGFGDVKYLFLLGLLFGIGSLPIVYGAIISGAIVGVIMMLSGKAGMRTQLPFGVFLSGATIIYLIGGWPLVDQFQFFQMMREILG